MPVGNLPIGTIIAWENASIPSGWAVCNGQNGTPDLRDKFVRGASVDGDIRATGGADSHTHTNPNTGSRSAHNHGGNVSDTVSGGESQWVTVGTPGSAATDGHGHSLGIDIVGANLHSHSIGTTGTGSNIPIYVKRVFIRRNS